MCKSGYCNSDAVCTRACERPGYEKSREELAEDLCQVATCRNAKVTGLVDPADNTPLLCPDLSGLCSDPDQGASVREVCPESCGLCDSTAARGLSTGCLAGTVCIYNSCGINKCVNALEDGTACSSSADCDSGHCGGDPSESFRTHLDATAHVCTHRCTQTGYSGDGEMSTECRNGCAPDVARTGLTLTIKDDNGAVTVKDDVSCQDLADHGQCNNPMTADRCPTTCGRCGGI